MIGIGTIFRRRTGSGGPLPPDYAKWVKEHMVFWYDMSKPVDVYIPGVTYANQFVNDGGKLTYDTTINKCTITHTPTSEGKCFWLVKCEPSSTIDSYRIRVTGLPKRFIIQSGFYSNKITSDGEYDIASYTNTFPSTRYPGFYLAGDNVNDVDCNIVVEEIPTKQSVPTNEILKANPYLQDHSGNNRPLKLNNFLFAAMSGVGGYEINWTDTTIWANFLGSRFEGKIESSKLTITSALVSSGVMETKAPSFSIGYKVRVTGITDESLVYGYINEAGQSLAIRITEDGEYELPSNNVVEATYNMRWRVIAASYPHTCNITIEQIPVYPNALVTDGVDDYGEVQNFVALQNYMMFYQCAVIKPTGTAKGMFSTVSSSNNINGWLLLQNQGKNTSRFGNGTYMNVQLPNDSEVKTDYILTGNGNKMTLYVGDETRILNGTYTSTGNTMGFFLSDYKSLVRYGSLAFYKSILFDAVPAKETDGFTEQDLIDYVLKNIITQ